MFIFFQWLSPVFIPLAIRPTAALTHIVATVVFAVSPSYILVVSLLLLRRGSRITRDFMTGWIFVHPVAVTDFLRIMGVIPYVDAIIWSLPATQVIALGFITTAVLMRSAQDQYLAGYDELTRLANRRQLRGFRQNEWSRNMRSRRPVSAIMVDADEFKAYNDTWGHESGDRCLVRIADILRRYARRSGDLVVRLDGEEFLIVLPEIDTTQAMHVADLVRRETSE